MIHGFFNSRKTNELCTLVGWMLISFVNEWTFQVLLSFCACVLLCVIFFFFWFVPFSIHFHKHRCGPRAARKKKEAHTVSPSSWHELEHWEILLSGLSDFKFQMATPHSRLISLKNNISKLHFDRSGFLTNNALS